MFRALQCFILAEKLKTAQSSTTFSTIFHAALSFEHRSSSWTFRKSLCTCHHARVSNDRFHEQSSKTSLFSTKYALYCIFYCKSLRQALFQHNGWRKWRREAGRFSSQERAKFIEECDKPGFRQVDVAKESSVFFTGNFLKYKEDLPKNYDDADLFAAVSCSVWEILWLGQFSQRPTDVATSDVLGRTVNGI